MKNSSERSEQEILLQSIWARSLGGMAAFHPDRYQNDEPADVAWVCGRTVMLFYCTRNSRSFTKGAHHNLKQARTWLNRWSETLRLKGRNEAQEFDVPRSAVDRVIVVSVVNAPECAGAIHLDYMQKLAARNVTVMGSLPESVVARIAELGGSVCDFVYIFEKIAEWGGLISESLLHSILEAYGSISEILINRGALTRDQCALLDHVSRALLAARLQRYVAPVPGRPNTDLAELGMHEHRRLISLAVEAAAELESSLEDTSDPSQHVAGVTKIRDAGEYALLSIAMWGSNPKVVEEIITQFEPKAYFATLVAILPEGYLTTLVTPGLSDISNVKGQVDRLSRAIRQYGPAILLANRAIDPSNNPRNPKASPA